MSIYLGIDFGTSTLYVTKWNADKQKAEPVPNLIPSGYGSSHFIDNVAYYEVGGNLILGKKALNHIQVDPLNGVREVKRHLVDDSWSQEIRGIKKTAKDIVSDIFAYIKMRVETIHGGEAITAVVISVPYAFEPRERKKIESAAMQAGLPVIALIEEPVAAALSCGLFDEIKPGTKETVLVFDLGGGTFDVTLFEAAVSQEGKRSVSVMNTDGDPGLGGVDIDHLMVSKFLTMMDTRLEIVIQPIQQAKFRNELYEEARQTKIALSSAFQHEVFKKFDVVDEPLDGIIYRDTFEGWLQGNFLYKIDNVLQRILADIELDISNVDQVILVGGSSNIPIIAEKVTAFFNRLPKMIDDPGELVGKGAAMYCGILSGGSEKIEIVRRTSHGIGVQVGSRVKQLLFRNEIYSQFSPYHDFTLPRDKKRGRINIYQGNSVFLDDCSVIGHIVVQQKDYRNGFIRLQLGISDKGLVMYRTYDDKGMLVKQGEATKI
jgi:molecular chaperone DnaK (HSP70)